MGESGGNVAIFWDYGAQFYSLTVIKLKRRARRIENCHPPVNIPGHVVADRIREAAQEFGTVTSFKAYMDVALESLNVRSIQLHADLQQSGVSLLHCPHNDREDVVDKMMIGAWLG